LPISTASPVGGDNLVFIGDFTEEEDNWHGYFALNKCEGDCDLDSECAVGLVCFAGDGDAIPGCQGDPASLGNWSYCIERPSQNYLAIVYDNAEVADQGIYPLGLCEGDCDTNDDCAEGLTCFQREGYEAVPGCEGIGDEGFDYCIETTSSDVPSSIPSDSPSGLPSVTPSTQPSAIPSDNPSDLPSSNPSDSPSDMPSSSPSKFPGELPISTASPVGGDNLVFIGDFTEEEDNWHGYFALNKCEGDCDLDSECAVGLVCFAGDGDAIPGCQGDPASLGNWSYCIERPSQNYLAIVYDNAEVADQGIYPLGLCEGDCDTNDDCAEGLTCFQREGYEAVPGCEGIGDEGHDYCVEAITDGDLFLVGDFTGNDEDWHGYFALNKCEGDCDFDSECAVGLVCFTEETGAVPGCAGDPTALASGSYNFCIERPSPTYLAFVYNEDIISDGIYPMGLCQGDCDEDADCGEGLYCFERDGFEEVPGCEGPGEEGVDYCVGTEGRMLRGGV